MVQPRFQVKRSTYEYALADVLDKNNVEYGYETERFSYVVKHWYKPDFVFYNTRILVEAKGWFTSKDRTKVLKAREAIEKDGWELRFVFEKPNNKLRPASKTTYALWCEQHGFEWANYYIPEEWYCG